MEQDKLAEKEKKKLELAAAQAAKDAQKKISPSEMFKLETDKYSQFDDKVTKKTYIYKSTSFSLLSEI